MTSTIPTTLLFTSNSAEDDSCSVSSEEAWDATYNALALGTSSAQDFGFHRGNDADDDAVPDPLPADVIQFTAGSIQPEFTNSNSLSNDFYAHYNNAADDHDDVVPLYQDQKQPSYHHSDEDYVEYIDTHSSHTHFASASSPTSSSFRRQQQKHRREQSVNSIDFFLSEPFTKKLKTDVTVIPEALVTVPHVIAPLPIKEEMKVVDTAASAPAATAAATPSEDTTAPTPLVVEVHEGSTTMEEVAATTATSSVTTTTTTNKKDSDICFHSFQSNQWQSRFQELVNYKQVRGTTCIPTKSQDNYPLAQWVKRQRYQYRLKQAGKKSTMTSEREQALESLGFIWDLHDSVWEERLQELYTFRAQHGHCKVPLKYPSNPELAIWAKCQRRHYMTYCTVTASGQEWTSNTMTLERIQKLTKVGFVFSNRNSSPVAAGAGAGDEGHADAMMTMDEEDTTAKVPPPTAITSATTTVAAAPPTTVSVYTGDLDTDDDAWEPIQIAL